MSLRFSPQSVGFLAGADLSSSKYLAVKLDSTQDQVVLAGAGEEAIGILLNIPESGCPADVAVAGGSFGIAGGSVSIGDKLKADASGKLVTASTDNDFYIARAIEAATSDDEFEVIIEKGFVGA